MPQAQTHLVNRCRLELDFQDGRDAEPMSAALMAACKDQFAEVIEDVCTAMVPSDAYITLDELDLDLGSIDPMHPIDDLVVKFRESLELRLAELLGQQPQSSPEQRAKSLLDDYLLTGQYPWWAGTPAPERLHEAIDRLLSHPSGGEWLARRLRQGGNPIARLVAGLPPAQVYQVWEKVNATLPPIAAQATLVGATRRAFVAPRIGRMAWTGFAERAIQFALRGPQYTGKWSNFTAQVANSIPEWRASSEPNSQDGFEVLVWWMLEVAQVPSEMLAEVIAHSVTGSDNRGRESQDHSSTRKINRRNASDFSSNAATGSKAFTDWWSNNWGWQAEHSQELAAGLRINWEMSSNRQRPEGKAIEQIESKDGAEAGRRQKSARSPHEKGTRHGKIEESGNDAFGESNVSESGSNGTASQLALPAILPWLRRILRQPEAGFLALIDGLTRVFLEETSSESVDVKALAEWMEARLPLQAAARAALSEVMFRQYQRARALSEESLQEELDAKSNVDALHPESHNIEAAKEISISADSSVLNQEENRLNHPTVQHLFSPILQHLYGLQRALNLPNSDLPAILEALLQRLMTSEDEINLEQDAIAHWLQQRFPLAAEVRTALSVELLHLAEVRLREVSHHARKDKPESDFQSSENAGNPTVNLADIPAPKSVKIDQGSGASSSADPRNAEAKEEDFSEVSTENESTLFQEVKMHLPWLQRTVGKPQGKLDELLSGLWEMYANATEATEAKASEIVEWLRQNFPLQPAARQVIAEAVAVQHRGKNAEVDSKQSEENSEPEIQLKSEDNAEPQGAPPTLEKAPKPKLPTQTAIVWLRKQLRKPDAGFASLIAQLLAQYQKDYPGAATTMLAFETWLKGVHHPPKQHVPILAQALVDAIETQPRPKPKPAAKSEPDKSLWIDNAGLILFSPFLQRYLQYAGLVEDKSWVSEEARHHGVRLLQMVVDPSGEWNEASLALPKLLCGLQPDSIVDPYIPLPEDLRGQDAALIEVALSHWTAAGKIGIEGFRAAWLARNASLRIRDDHWLLRVEAMGHDMLLELLPWDIAYISLPWMSAVIYVDWGEKAKFNAI